MKVYFGNNNEQKVFSTHFKDFIECLPKIENTINMFIFNSVRQSLKEHVFSFVARMIAQDLVEILVLVSNGLTTGGMKILRGMFERTVTILYLSKKTEEIDLFYEYYWIDMRRLRNTTNEIYPGLVPEETKNKIEEQYKRVKEKFEITDCKKCKTKRVNYTWSKTDIVSMAKEVGFGSSIIQAGYYFPLEETHLKVGAILRRAELTGEDKFTYNDAPDLDQNKMTIMLAHMLTLKAFEVLVNNFSVEGFNEKVEDCNKDYNRIWGLEQEMQ